MEITMKRKPTTKRTGAAPADKLVTKATENGDVGLTEDELKKVSGGVFGLNTKIKD
jgi:bacteriocin-like protein